MTALADRPISEKFSLLDPFTDLKAFDHEAITLVLRMQAQGWRGRMGRRGHALMYSPDGTATACVTRDSLRGRSGRNAARPFNQWLQAQEAARAEQESAFGNVPGNHTSLDIPPWATIQQSTAARLECKRVLSSFWQDYTNHGPAGAAVWVNSSTTDGDWSVFWRPQPGDPVELVAAGPASGDPWEDLYGSMPGLRPQPGSSTRGSSMEALATVEVEQSHDPTSIPVTGLGAQVCPVCDQVFTHRGAYALHVATHPTGEPFPCPEPGCDAVFDTSHKLGGHKKKHTNDARRAAKAEYEAREAAIQAAKALSLKDCPVCGDQISARGMPLHLDKHVRNGDVRDGQVIDRPRARLRPVPEPEPAPKSAANKKQAPATVVDFLSDLPTGKTAEDQVARVRAVVAGPLMEELRVEREGRKAAEERAEKAEALLGETKARLDILLGAMQEASSL